VKVPHPFDPKPWYNPKRDGTLDEYFERFDEQQACPLFKGYAWFEKLRDRGYLMPNVSFIRIMWNVGREDEHYRVTADFKLEDIVGSAHSGQQGIHDPKKILARGPAWEPQHVLSTPELREKYGPRQKR